MKHRIWGGITRGWHQAPDGSICIDAEGIEYEWLSNCSPKGLLQEAREVIEEADSAVTGDGRIDLDELEDLEFRSAILRFIEEIENWEPQWVE